MTATATALMILLQCPPNGVDCREFQLADSYRSIAECRRAVPMAVERFSSSRETVTGRCILAADSIFPQIDPIITGSVPQATGEALVTVRVTRPGTGAPVSTLFVVPKVAR